MAIDGKVLGDGAGGGGASSRSGSGGGSTPVVLLSGGLQPQPPSVEVINIEDGDEDTDVCSEKKENKMKEREDNNNNEKKMKKGKCRDVVDGERYELAERKLSGLMREMGAELGRPVARKKLEEEERTPIRVTTLAPSAHARSREGDQRWRMHRASVMNCCDEGGPTVFWLDPPEQEDNRRKSGVTSPLIDVVKEWRFTRRKNAKGVAVFWLEPVEGKKIRKRDFGEATSIPLAARRRRLGAATGICRKYNAQNS